MRHIWRDHHKAVSLVDGQPREGKHVDVVEVPYDESFVEE